MKKVLLSIMVAVLLIIGFAACSGGDSNYPFKAISEYFSETLEDALNNPDKLKDEGYLASTTEKMNSLAKELYGKSIAVDVEDGIGFSLSPDDVKIGEGEYRGEHLRFNINVNLKINNEKAAEDHYLDLMAVLYNDEGKPVKICTYLSKELPLTIEEIKKARSMELDSIPEIIDSIPDLSVNNNDVIEASDNEAKDNNSTSKADNPYAVGKIICKGMELYLEGVEIITIGNASKLVIMEHSFDNIKAIKQEIKELEDKTTEELKKKAMAAAVKYSTEHKNDGSIGGTYTLKDQLGPIQFGKTITNIPKKVEGLYDDYSYKKQKHSDEMDGDWIEEYYLFKKDGQEVFRVDIYENKVNSIRLLSGSTFIKTPDGIGVGYSARELFKKKRMEWVNYYDGTCFGTSGNYLYYVNPEELVGTDIPNKAEDFKPDAKVIGIAYVSN